MSRTDRPFSYGWLLDHSKMAGDLAELFSAKIDDEDRFAASMGTTRETLRQTPQDERAKINLAYLAWCAAHCAMANGATNEAQHQAVIH